jgi:zinc protease
MRTLPNGLRVVVFVRPGLPIVQAQLQVSAGLRSEATGHAGLAFLTAQLIRQGTSSRSAQDFAVELDTLGATFATSVLRDVAQVAAGCRTQEFEGMLELMSDAVVNPLFSEEAFQAVRRQVAGQLGVQAQNPAALADERAGAALFGGHPYGHPAYGMLGGLLSSTRDEVREFHRDHWRPDRAVLAIAGDIDPERAFASSAEWFGRWAGRAGADPAAAAPSPRRGVLLLDLPGSPVTEIRALALAPGRAAPGYADWSVARELLEAGALPPGARATLVPAKEASMFMLSTTARPESAAVVASRLRGAIRDFSSRTPSATAIADARRRAAHAFPLTLESNGQLLASWLAGDVAGLPASHLASTPASFEGANGASAIATLGGELTLLVAGPAQRMRGTLASLGRVDTLRDESEPAVAPVGVEVSAEQRRRGRQLADQALAAHGGAKPIRAVRASYVDGELRMNVAGQEVTGEVRYQREDPDRLAYTTRFLEFEHRQVLDRNRGWMLSMAGDSAAMQVADSISLQSLRGILESDVVHILRDVADPKSDVFARGKETFEGKPVERIEFTNRVGLRTRLTLEEPSRRIVLVETAPTPQGGWRDRRRWSEFAQVEGVWWPRHEVRELDGERVSSVTFHRFVVNGPQDTTIFRKPLVARGQIRGLED